MKLVGTEALVTGANRGLGKSLVKALAKAGTSRIHAGARSRFQLPADALRASIDTLAAQFEEHLPRNRRGPTTKCPRGPSQNDADDCAIPV